MVALNTGGELEINTPCNGPEGNGLGHKKLSSLTKPALLG